MSIKDITTLALVIAVCICFVILVGATMSTFDTYCASIVAAFAIVMAYDRINP